MHLNLSGMLLHIYSVDKTELYRYNCIYYYGVVSTDIALFFIKGATQWVTPKKTF